MVETMSLPPAGLREQGRPAGGKQKYDVMTVISFFNT